MAKSCPVLPANIQKDYNQLSLTYSKSMSIEEARVKAAETMLRFTQQNLPLEDGSVVGGLKAPTEAMTATGLGSFPQATFANYLANITGNPNTVKEVMDTPFIPPELRLKMVKEATARANARNTRPKQEQNALFGSTAGQNQHPYTTVASALISNKDDIRSIFGMLGSIGFSNKTDSAKHTEQLNKVVDEMIVPLADQLSGMKFNISTPTGVANNPFGEYSANSTNPRLDREINLKLNSIANPFLNQFRLSFQEIAAHEFVHATTTAAYTAKENFALKKGIDSLYNQARLAITPAMFSQTVGGVTTTAAENQATYDYIFNNPNGQGVQEFMAFGTTNELFRNMLSKLEVKKATKKIKSFKDAIDVLFEKIVDFIARKTFRIEGKTVDQALDTLIKELSGITEKQNNIIDYVSYGLEGAKWAGSKTLDQIVRPLASVIQSPRAPVIVQSAVAIIKNWQIFSKVLNLSSAVGTTINNLVKHKEYFFWNLILKLPQELAGMNVTNEAWHNLLKHSKNIVDAARHKIKEATIFNVRESIGSMSDEDKSSLTTTILYSDLDDLKTYNPEFSLEDFRGVLADDADRQARIAALESKLTSMFGKIGSGYIRQAHSLGLFIQTKKTYAEGYQAFNAHSIARGDWDTKFARPSNWQEAIPLIQQLKTLHSLNYTSKHDRDVLVKFIDSQAAITVDEGNGFNNLLTLNVLFKRDALEKLFDNDPTLMMAGYHRDINDPSVAIKYSSDPADKNLEDRGYIRVKNPLGQSNLHSHPKNYMYVSNNNGLVAYDKKTVSLTSTHLAGTSLTDLLVNEGWEYGNASAEAKVQSAVIVNRINRAEMYSTTIDPAKTGSLVPVFDGAGNISSHRYIMEEKTRRKILKKDTRIDQVFGAMYESLSDKVESPKVNTKVVEELKKEYQTMYAKKPKGFVVVTKDHPKYGEIYRLLPKEMKAELDVVFGEGRMVVREAMMDIIFGYRKYSLFAEGDNIWLGKMMKKIVVDVFRVTPGKYYRIGRTAEQSWQILINELKTAIVLKTTVLGYNILSNTIISFMHGTPLNYITKKQGEAVLAVEDYTVKHRQKLVLEQRLATVDISPAAKKNIEAKIVQLNADMDKSPIKSLIDEGLLNSIVEDVTTDDSDFGIKGEVFKYLAGKTKWVPKPVVTAYEIGQIGPKTALYKLLEKTTRYSDFVARHAMYEWYTQERGMPKVEALQLVTETFVNYELPTSKELQYLNDMGAYMFTKYAVRIQKTIYKLLVDKPKSVVGLLAVEGMTGNITDPTDSWDIFPGIPRNPMDSMDEVVLPLYQALWGILK